MRQPILFCLFLFVIFANLPQTLHADMKARCLSPEDQWKLCHIDFEPMVFKWRLKNQAWMTLPGQNITRLVEKSPPAQPDPLVLGFPVETSKGKEATFYVPVEWASKAKSLLAIEYALDAGGRKTLILALSEADAFVLKSKLESISGRRIEHEHGR